MRTFLTLAVLLAASPAGAADDAPTTRVLVVGQNRYANGASLQHAERDAEAVADVFVRLAGPRCEAVRMTGGRGGADPRRAPTAAAVLAELGRLAAASGPSDRLIVFLAGHALPGPASDVLFVPAGGNPTDPGTLISLARVSECLRGCRAAHKLGVFDCCRRAPVRAFDARPVGGPAVFDLDSATRPSPGVSGTERGTCTFVFSCSPGEFSYESDAADERHGVLSLLFLRGLDGAADANADRKVTHDELVGYLRREVPPFVRARWDDNQHPQVVDDSNATWVLADLGSPAARGPRLELLLGRPTVAGGVAGVRVRLVDPAGRALADHVVRASYPGGTDEARTAADGTVTFPVAVPAGCRPGEYRVQLEHLGHGGTVRAACEFDPLLP